MSPDKTEHSDMPDEEDPLLSGEEDSEDEDDGKGDTTALALDVPEPAQAIAADAGLGKAGPGEKGLKGKGGKAGKAKAGDKSALDVAFSDEMLGLEDAPEAEESDAEIQQDISAYDGDEITDPEIDDIDPLMMVLGGQEKPWENEKLSVVERMMMDPGYERDLDALNRDRDSEEPRAKTRDKNQGIKGAAIAASVVALAAGVAAAQGNEKGPGMAGVARGPQRAAEQDQMQVKAEAKKPGINQTHQSEPITVQARRNAEEVTLRRIGTGLAATIGVNNSAADFDKSKAAVTRSEGLDLADLIELQQQTENNVIGNDIGWSPQAGKDQQFNQTMDMIYASLGTQTLMNVSPYRQAGWDEKRLEQKENSQDVTIAPQAPEPKTPSPEPAYQRDYQINLGPGGM